MTWDEKAADAAIEYAKPQMRPVQTVSDHMADAFHEGARWQREALLSDESVERAARALYETDRAEYDGDKPWPPRPHFIEDMYRERARAALTAAIGDDDEG